ncbi:MAG: hypothetical protein JW718_02705 [Desulfovibrionaceae bacterium]|nr:hypothetical protein [Desulfovibrionaceae bacterium]
MIIGVDLDNTIVGYDRLFHLLGVERGYIEPSTPASKAAVRDAVRRGPGDEAWQVLQAEAYGPRMAEAEILPGAIEFFRAAARAGHVLYIVSHKTEYAGMDAARSCNMRETALSWLRDKGFFQACGLGPERVYFESTRDMKAARITELGCEVFVDDLIEVFEEPGLSGSLRRVLFGAGPQCPVAGLEPCPDWDAVSREVLGGSAEDCDWSALVGGPARVSAMPCRGGNSRLFMLSCADGRVLAGKRYFRDRLDPRDRLGAERLGLTVCGRAGLPAPGLVAWDEGCGALVMDFVQGHPPGRPGAGDIDAAVDFLVALKGQHDRSGAGESVPDASEACYSGLALERNLFSRLARLEAVSGVGAAHEAFADLRSRIRDQAAGRIRAARRDLARTGQAWDQDLDPAARTLSPSDFGFHNALRRPDRSLCFLDFEYFGRDDPAKTLCDFVQHPAMGLERGLRRRFTRRFLKGLDSPGLAKRAKAFFPLYRIKWCLILLNEFVRQDRARRRFAGRIGGEGQSLEELLAAQLAKAQDYLETVDEEHERLREDLA